MDALDFKFANPGIQNSFQQPYPYASSIASSASSSSSSVFSFDGLSSSQSSISSSTSSVDIIWENEASSQSKCRGVRVESGSRCIQGQKSYAVKATETLVAPELRQHPRRSFRSDASALGSRCARPPPPLTRASQRRVNFVDHLVDSAAQIVETIWPLSVVAARSDSALGCKGVLPLRSFIQETLRRSRTSYSTLQVALYYLILIKPRIPTHDFTVEQSGAQQCSRAMQCGRRMFLSALILASKYLQDRNYSARAWSKISGLSTTEINQNELIFLNAVAWRLHISEPVFQRWSDIVLRYTSSTDGAFNGDGLSWRSIIPSLNPELDTIDLDPVRNGHVSIQDLLSPVTTPSPSRSPVSGYQYQPSTYDQTPTYSHSRGVRSTLGVESAQELRLPSLPKLGVLPTPQMSPQSVSDSTPAAGAVSFTPRGPSMTCAMRQAQRCAQRTTLDQRPPLRAFNNKPASYESYPLSTRRSSLARSSTSSPESMISDVPSLASSLSSRSSRSSSISSVASGTCAPTLPRLATRAMRRGANKENRKPLAIGSPIDEGSYQDIIYTSPEPMSASSVNVPDLTNFSLGTPVDKAHEAAQSLCELSAAVPRSTPSLSASSSPNRMSRKRGRTNSSTGMVLQHHVRNLISLDARKDEDDSTYVIPDNRVADSFLIPQPKAVQSPARCSFGGLRFPLPLSFPMETGSVKRACCGTEATQVPWGMSSASAESVVDMVD
ncbi:cyclin [Coccidioides posadasii str. Silveira]|uniref:Cyclin n=1 Tax=Coccidioides posadasii (strain RMSCC 757 / Silveira) TaxID=443226 RepID=E9DAK9_COCPS|nr:cyclin [Coccidioides posadasii str. Silveira]